MLCKQLLETPRSNQGCALCVPFCVALQYREAIEAALQGIGSGIKSFLASGQVFNALGLLFAAALGIYVAREGVKFLIAEVQRRIGQPSLVRETSQRGTCASFGACMRRAVCCGRGATKGGAFGDVVLPKTLTDQIDKLALSTR